MNRRGGGESGLRRTISTDIHTWKLERQSHGLSQTMSVWFVITDTPLMWQTEREFVPKRHLVKFWDDFITSEKKKREPGEQMSR